MTPQEQYKKFYDKPHLWINAIEVECVNPISTVNLFSQERRHFNFGETYSLAENYSFIRNNIDCFAPKFKPQRGKQFIKDLEAAVSAGIKDKSELWEDTLISKVGDNLTWYVVKLKTEDFWVEVKVFVGNISQVVVSGMLLDAIYNDNLGAYCFDTAAYVDKMRELGYYFVK